MKIERVKLIEHLKTVLKEREEKKAKAQEDVDNHHTKLHAAVAALDFTKIPKNGINISYGGLFIEMPKTFIDKHKLPPSTKDVASRSHSALERLIRKLELSSDKTITIGNRCNEYEAYL